MTGHATDNRVPKTRIDQIMCLFPYLMLTASTVGLLLSLYFTLWISVATFVVLAATNVLQVKQVRRMFQ